jgi:hypothetical protein
LKLQSLAFREDALMLLCSVTALYAALNLPWFVQFTQIIDAPPAARPDVVMSADKVRFAEWIISATALAPVVVIVNLFTTSSWRRTRVFVIAIAAAVGGYWTFRYSMLRPSTEQFSKVGFWLAAGSYGIEVCLAAEAMLLGVSVSSIICRSARSVNSDGASGSAH